MAYDLANRVKATGTKRKVIDIRPIQMTRALESDLYQITRVPVDAWIKQVNERILPAYDRAISQLITDSPDGDVRGALTVASAEVTLEATSSAITLRVQAWLDRVVGWHTQRWTASVRAATGVDAYPFINLAESAPQIAAMQDRIVSLIRSIDQKMRDDITQVVWDGFLNRTPRRKLGKDIAEKTGIGRRRANFIAQDQANKTAAELTRIRQQEAGITRFKWDATMDSRTRPSHAALNGQIFAWDKPPEIGLPGTPPRCRCSAAAVLDLEE